MEVQGRLESIPDPELVIGLVGPVGVDLERVTRALEAQLARVAYSVVELRVSSLICQVQAYRDYARMNFASDFERIHKLMDAGSTLRRETGRGDALSLLAIAEIRRMRMELNKQAHPDWTAETCVKTPLPRTAYVLRSLKNPAEVRTLRDVYGRAFFVISTYAPRGTRVTDLARRIAHSASDSDYERYRGKAEELIGRDESEGDKLGQNVRECFPLADVFVDLGHPSGLDESLERFVEILFGHPFHTPSRDEFAMFHAYATALRSADLSRQVGAAIATDDGQILAVGCNEVPKYGGGHYWASDDGDRRDHRTGHDSGTTTRVDMVSEVVQRFQEAGLVSAELGKLKPREAAEQLIWGARKHVLQGAQVLNVIEYGRAVHAEMAALSDAARRGVSVQDSTLYCTTFPCHLCARHIIAAGIKRVVYIEPYPKSAAATLFSDSMVVDPERSIDDRVAFQAFVGVAPTAYSFMFRAARERKTPDGAASVWTAGPRCTPRFRRFVLSYMSIEAGVTAEAIPATFRGKYAMIDATDGGS